MKSRELVDKIKNNPKATRDQINDWEQRWQNWLHETYGYGINYNRHRMIFSKAWADGHSAGYQEVEYYYGELCDFVTEILNA